MIHLESQNIYKIKKKRVNNYIVKYMTKMIIVLLAKLLMMSPSLLATLAIHLIQK